MKNNFLLLVSFLALFSCSTSPYLGIVGETATIKVVEADMDYLSRIDTGAKSTSIHATNIKIKNDSAKKKENIGKNITFTTTNAQNKTQVVSAKIVDVSTVKNSQGVEQRYIVEMTLRYKGRDKKIMVNLRNRSEMTYKLLIGRNWLAGDYLVDVTKKAEVEK
jgi:hypothetical protein